MLWYKVNIITRSILHTHTSMILLLCRLRYWGMFTSVSTGWSFVWRGTTRLWRSSCHSPRLARTTTTVTTTRWRTSSMNATSWTVPENSLGPSRWDYLYSHTVRSTFGAWRSGRWWLLWARGCRVFAIVFKRVRLDLVWFCSGTCFSEGCKLSIAGCTLRVQSSHHLQGIHLSFFFTLCADTIVANHS